MLWGIKKGGGGVETGGNKRVINPTSSKIAAPLKTTEGLMCTNQIDIVYLGTSKILMADAPPPPYSPTPNFF